MMQGRGLGTQWWRSAAYIQFFMLFYVYIHLIVSQRASGNAQSHNSELREKRMEVRLYRRFENGLTN